MAQSRTTGFALVARVAVLVLATAKPPQALPPFKFAVDPAKVVASVDRTLLGGTLEDTSFSLYGGGIYSQLIYGESFEEPRLEGAAVPRTDRTDMTWAGTTSTKSACYTLIPGKSKAPEDSAFNGRQSLRMTASNATCLITNMGGGGDRWGIPVHAGHTMEGYFFARGHGTIVVGLCPPASSGSGMMAPSSCYDTVTMAVNTASAASTMGGGSSGWQQHPFSLAPTKSNRAGSFAVWVEHGTVDVDSFFLEDTQNLYPGARHTRKDLADATLLNGSFGFLRFGGDMAGRSSYAWHTMRGPAWLRPPQTPGSWSPYSSNGWGMFEFLQFREAAGIERAILGTASGLPDSSLGKCARPAESLETIADLAEYLYAPQGSSSKLAQLRISDGHALPYNDSGLVIEVGNECHCTPGYFTSFNATVAAMSAHPFAVQSPAISFFLAHFLVMVCVCVCVGG